MAWKVVLIVIGIVVVLVVLDLLYMQYQDNSLSMISTSTPPTASAPSGVESTMVTATGTMSAVVNGTQTVTVALTFPLQGGTVTGNVSGSCTGTLAGTYENGAIEGEGNGNCELVVPASVTFSGTVDQTSREVFLNATGTAAGLAASRAMTLQY